MEIPLAPSSAAPHTPSAGAHSLSKRHISYFDIFKSADALKVAVTTHKIAKLANFDINSNMSQIWQILIKFKSRPNFG